MMVLAWGLALFAGAFGLHLAIWRVRLPRRQTRALVMLFLGLLAAGELAFWLVTSLAGGRGWAALPDQPAQWLGIAVLTASMAMAYITTYSAMQVESPSLLMVLAIAKAGPQGLPPERLQSVLSDDLMVRPRIRDLVRDGLVVAADGRYTITGKGRRLVGIFRAYRDLLGAAKGG
jgi:hypothetical protein